MIRVCSAYNRPILALSVDIDEALKAEHCVEPDKEIQLCASVPGMMAKIDSQCMPPSFRRRLFLCSRLGMRCCHVSSTPVVLTAPPTARHPTSFFSPFSPGCKPTRDRMRRKSAEEISRDAVQRLQQAVGGSKEQGLENDSKKGKQSQS